MEDFFNVLIVLITLIGFAISAISKSNKRKRKAQQGSQQSNFFESIFEDSQESDYTSVAFAEEKIPDKPEIETVSEEKNKKDTEDKALEYFNDNEGQSAFAIDEENNIYSGEIKDDIEDSDYDDENDKVLEDFELRDAIIYSDILNRKNY